MNEFETKAEPLEMKIVGRNVNVMYDVILHRTEKRKVESRDEF